MKLLAVWPKGTSPEGRNSLVRITSLAVCAIVLLAPSRADSPVGSRDGSNATKLFSAAAQAVIRRWNVTVVAESRPIAGPAEPAALSIAPNDTVDIAIERLANAFDYTATRHERVFVLSKNFTRIDDLPDISLVEARDAVLAISHLYSTLEPKYAESKVPSSPRGVAIVNSLNKAQLAALSQGGVPVSSLAPDQKAEMWKFAVSFYIQPMPGIDAAGAYLSSLCKQDPTLRWGAVGLSNEFGFEAQVSVPPKMVFLPLSHLNTISTNYSGAVTISGDSVGFINGVPQAPAPDPTEPGQGTARNRNGAPAETIASVVAALNEREPGKCQVDHAFKEKRVTVFGMNNASASRIMDAIAEVYGLEVRHRYDGTMIIARSNAIARVPVVSVVAQFAALVPRPALRALQKGFLNTPLSKFGPLQDRMMTGYPASGRLIRYAAAKEVRSAGEPAVRVSKSGKVRLSELDADARLAFAVSQAIAPLARALSYSPGPPPPFITDFDHIILTGGLATDDKGASRLALFLSYRDPVTGKMYQGVGINNALIPPNQP